MPATNAATAAGLPTVAGQALEAAGRLWSATTKLMAQLHVVRACEAVALEQQGTALQAEAQENLHAADSALAGIWRATTTAQADWISHACRLHAALQRAAPATLLTLQQIEQVAEPLLAPDGEMNASDALRFGSELLQQQAAAATRPRLADTALIARLSDVADAIGHRAAGQGIEQIEAAGELMREAANALRLADMPWRTAVLSALMVRAIDRHGLDQDPAGAIGALLLAAHPLPAKSPSSSRQGVLHG